MSLQHETFEHNIFDPNVHDHNFCDLMNKTVVEKIEYIDNNLDEQNKCCREHIVRIWKTGAVLEQIPLKNKWTVNITKNEIVIVRNKNIITMNIISEEGLRKFLNLYMIN